MVIFFLMFFGKLFMKENVLEPIVSIRLFDFYIFDFLITREELFLTIWVFIKWETAYLDGDVKVAIKNTKMVNLR